ncbi:MAG TPA: tetratricopeptide repeat protein, partial [Pirellulales bacterium]|nr:tetratricopeptide repeat protein [Pirellulales bacterium]
MSDFIEKLQLAMHSYRSGDLRQAELLGQEVLAAKPTNAQAHHLLGVTRLAQGHAARAVGHLERAVELQGDVVSFRHHLALALRRAGQQQTAIACLREVIAREPHWATAHNDLGGALREVGQLAEAEASYRQAILADPTMAEAHNNLGNVLLDRQEWCAAVAAFRQAIRLRPEMGELHFNLGNVYKLQGLWADAAAAYRQALERKPRMAEALHNLGIALEHQQQFAEAIDCQQKALSIRPDFVEAHADLGKALQGCGQMPEAMACYRRALTLKPGDPTAAYNLGTACYATQDYRAAEVQFRAVLDTVADSVEALAGLAQARLMQGDRHEARRCVDEILRLKSDDEPAVFFRGILALAAGDWQMAWKDHEYRVCLPTHSKRDLAQPRWDGSTFTGQTILAYAECGFGDTLQFIRYLPLVRGRGPGGRVLVEVQPQVLPLLKESGFSDVIAAGDPLPPYDLQIPLLSLPGLFRTSPDSVPADVPYLFASPRLVKHWRDRLSAIEGFKVGIHWQGNRAYVTDRHRSIPLEAFEVLARVPDVRLVSLQKSSAAETSGANADPRNVIVFEDLDSQHGPFMDTAAVIQNLDLVITSDSAVAHLAGALGAKVWVPLSTACEWRWLL